MKLTSYKQYVQWQPSCAMTAEELSLGCSRHGEGENDDDNSSWESDHERGAFNVFEDFLNE